MTKSISEIGLISLLSSTKGIVTAQHEIERYRGEKFNVFEILNVTTDENKLHSRLIGELLNPKGSHLKNSLFLTHFLKVIECKTINPDEAEVYLEQSVGKVDHDTGMGGRIDIYILDRTTGNTVSIENKIYAGDQKKQVVRYHAHNKDKNSVYYLTLDGREASKESSDGLVPGSDYQPIAYDKEIINWLELCHRDAADNPILRESIKQYMVVIKKLTNDMEDEQEEKLRQLMVNHLEEADYIATNFSKFRRDAKEQFREVVSASINDRLLKEKVPLKAKVGSKINSRYAQIWIDSEVKKPLRFGIETFNGDRSANLNGVLFVGLFDNSKVLTVNDEFNHYSTQWPHYQELAFDGSPIHFGEYEFLKIIMDVGSDNYKSLLDHIVNESIRFIIETNDALPEEHKLFIKSSPNDQGT
ncbi:PD-(D/E)XK nuclease family protein [Marinoscillum sp.]|uniref:PDDEXK-like family protein n=1 Tax=Marinoscillum sp. TaxID=2024838 RepID=UPI003BAB3ED1